MSDKGNEFAAFHTARQHPKPEKRSQALAIIKRRNLLLRLITASTYDDSRLGAIRKLETMDTRKAKPEELRLYFRLAMEEPNREIRTIASKLIDPSERDKLTGSVYPDMRLMVALMTSSWETLLRLLVDSDEGVRRQAEKSLGKRGLQHTRPHSVN